jgi:ectoine hydroxylase-related dioxygenase (phytanoyl-CoA dioxygenase family)
VRRRTTDRALRRNVRELVEKGVTLLRGAVAASLCDDVRADYHEYCAGDPGALEFADASGRHSRLANFHLASEAAMQVGLNPVALSLLDVCFAAPAAIYSSLTFEKGTEQDVHRDSPFFCTEPEGRFLGVWTALEDVTPDAGPLVYYPGAHRVDVDPRRLAAEHVTLDVRDVTERYRACVLEAAAAMTDPVVPVMRKGDTLVWHAQLPHGGQARNDPAATRASIVFHCVPDGEHVYGPDVFFGRVPAVPQPLRVAERGGRHVEDHGYVHFEPDF